METINKLGLQIVEWKKKSELGEVCGILNCEEKPTVHCPRCGNWYCGDHSIVHFHVI